jgi:hypothetical protein
MPSRRYSESTYAEIAETFGKERMDLLHGLLKELTQALDALPPRDHSDVTLDGEVAGLVSGRRRGRPRGGRE